MREQAQHKHQVQSIPQGSVDAARAAAHENLKRHPKATSPIDQKMGQGSSAIAGAQKSLKESRLPRRSNDSYASAVRAGSQVDPIADSIDPILNANNFKSKGHKGQSQDVLPEKANKSKIETKASQQTSDRLRDQISYLARKLQSTEQELEMATAFEAKARKYRMENAHLNAELGHAIDKNKQLQQDLDQCKERILQMQPFKEATEIEISEGYVDLCSAIEAWCEKQFGSIESFAKALYDLHWTPDEVGIIKEYLVQDGEYELAKAQPETSVYVLMYMTCLNLYKELFQVRRWTLGMEDVEENLLGGMLRAMMVMKPARDPKAIGIWRSEAYRALMEVPEYAEKHEVGLLGCTEVLKPIFKKLAGMVTEDGFDEDRFHTLTLDAAKLAAKIATSSDQYRLEYYFKPGMPKDARLLHVTTLENFNMIDVESGQPVTGGFDIEASSNGVVGEMLAVIFPTLECIGSDGKGKIVEKSTILVKFEWPIKRRGKGKGQGQAK